LNDQDSIAGRGGESFSLHRVHTDSGTHPVLYPMGTRGFSPVVNSP